MASNLISVEQIKEKMIPILRNYPVEKAILFGSFAKGEAILKTINYIDSILEYTSNVAYVEFINNTMMVEACVFNLSQIGELVNKLDKE